MYQSFISDDNIMFIRHYGAMQGAETFTATLNTLKFHSVDEQLKAVCVDFRDVTNATLEDSDGAFRDIVLSKLDSYHQNVNSFSTVTLYDPKNVRINEIIFDRGKRQSSENFDFTAVFRAFSLPEALTQLGLPLDYCIEYPCQQ